MGCSQLIGVDGDYVEGPTSVGGSGGAIGDVSGGTSPKNAGGMTQSVDAGQAGVMQAGSDTGGTPGAGGSFGNGGTETSGGRNASSGGRPSTDGGSAPEAGAGGTPPIDSGGAGGNFEGGAPNGGTGGASKGGTTNGGSHGGSPNGGSPNGGKGGTTNGGTSSGGAPSGGSPNGGSPNGGTGGANPCGITGSSCKALGNICGVNGDESCCAALPVPGTASGATFNRDNKTAAPATLSSFVMDKFEITLGRFRAFVDAYPSAKPDAGCGANPSDSNDAGWLANWSETGLLPVDKAALIQEIANNACSSGSYIWSADDHTNDARPMNCLTWYTAYAFCIWDGGRLPTELEWNYAAAGGTEQRKYPWGSTMPDDSRAVYGGQLRSVRVGSKSPAGDGRWGHADLAGNSWEWIRDTFTGAQEYVLPCADCANLTSGGSGTLRGGGFGSTASVLLTTARVGQPNRKSLTNDNGARCVR